MVVDVGARHGVTAGELSIASMDFRRLWAGPEPRGATPYGSHFFQPDVGELHLRTEVFPIVSSPGQQLIAQPAALGSRSAEALALLSTLAVRS
nr:hypothetical protein [Nonomuraea endophytica]